MKFTPPSIKALKPRAERYEIWENGQTGLGIRISPKGRKSWIFMYRFEGRARRMTLGNYPVMGMADANLEHAKAIKLKELGKDPGAIAKDERKGEREADTVQELMDEFLAYIENKNKTTPERRRMLEKDVAPAWGKRKAKSIVRRDVVKLIDGIADRGAPIQANRTYGVIRRMFNYAIGKDIVQANPCSMIELPGEERQRDRVLSEKEIQTLWNRLPNADMAEVIRLVLKFQLVTLQRKGEIVTAEKSEFDGNVWTIPARKTKNGLAHRVPLSPLSIELLRNARKLDKKSKWMFPSPRGENAVTARAVDHALRKAITDTEQKKRKIKLDDVRPHDLRRSGASTLTSMGFPRLTVAKLLNHAESGVTAVYDRHSYDPEKRLALTAWAQELERIISGEPKADNVVKIA